MKCKTFLKKCCIIFLETVKEGFNLNNNRENNAERLIELRLSQFMSRQEFAELINVSINTYRSWETGRRKCPDFVISMIEKIIELNEKRV